MENNQDRIIFTFTVLWEAWGCDSKSWVMERHDGSRYLRMTEHGGSYEAGVDALHRRITAYEDVLDQTRVALDLLNFNDKDSKPIV